MEIKRLKKEDLNESNQKQISELFNQLSENKKQLNLKEIITNNNHISLVYCIDNNQIIGMASMCTYKVISGHKGWIEDVVVNLNSRGKGVGKLLIRELICIAKEKELSEVLLFTENHRESAIHLYKKLGFKVKDTKVYNIKNYYGNH